MITYLGGNTIVNETLREMERGPEFNGSTSGASLALMCLWVLQHQPQRVLQLGTLIGYSAIALAEHLPATGTLYTIDPDLRKLALAHAFAVRSGFERRIVQFPGKSTDSRMARTLANVAPFDMIFIDSSHAYDETVIELETYTRPPYFYPTKTTIFLHDSSMSACENDPTKQGGVRRAIKDFMGVRDGEFRAILLEPPLWPDPHGLAILQSANSLPAV